MVNRGTVSRFATSGFEDVIAELDEVLKK